MDHGQVQRAEVLVKWEVRQIVVDVEEEGVLEVLRWFCVAHPVEFIYMSRKGGKLKYDFYNFELCQVGHLG